VIEAVTAGVAFLAAGAIIQARGRVQGLTTGAAMWLAGAVGVACGAGYYSIALMAALLAVAILTVLAMLERPSDKPEKPTGTRGSALD
jgi:putative Mg2+ transporter-C (MgtC) family protein